MTYWQSSAVGLWPSLNRKCLIPYFSEWSEPEMANIFVESWNGLATTRHNLHLLPSLWYALIDTTSSHPAYEKKYNTYIQAKNHHRKRCHSLQALIMCSESSCLSGKWKWDMDGWTGFYCLINMSAERRDKQFHYYRALQEYISSFLEIFKATVKGLVCITINKKMYQSHPRFQRLLRNFFQQCFPHTQFGGEMKNCFRANIHLRRQYSLQTILSFKAVPSWPFASRAFSPVLPGLFSQRINLADG